MREPDHIKEMEREDKQKILDLLLPALQATRTLHDLVSLEYAWQHDYSQYVEVTFENGYKKQINVSMDSGTGMIRDIMEYIC